MVRSKSGTKVSPQKGVQVGTASRPPCASALYIEGPTVKLSGQVDTCGTHTFLQTIDRVDSPLAQEPQQLKAKDETATGSSPIRLHTSVFSFL